MADAVDASERGYSREISDVKADSTFTKVPGFSRQYASVYYSRLQLLGPNIKPDWNVPYAKRVLDLVPGQVAWFKGTISRELAHKPSIIDDLVKVNHGMMPTPEDKYYSDDDKLFVEDDHGRIEIIGAQEKSATLLVTGCVVGIKGTQDSQGLLHVSGLCFPSFVPPAQVPTQSRPKGKIAFVSGLLLDDVKHEDVSHQLLIDFMAGNIIQDISETVQRLFICGNSLTQPSETLVGSRVLRATTSTESLKRLDKVLYQLSRYLPVHVLPGQTDPTTVAFPQQPLHRALFSSSRQAIRDSPENVLALETNPQKFDFGGITVLGSSGQPIIDLQKYGPGSALDMLENTLIWRHIAPTAPDTLPSYPYLDTDPLVLTETPHVYFAGNMDEFATDVRQGTRLISVPKFTDTHTIVLLDLETLEVQAVKLA